MKYVFKDSPDQPGHWQDCERTGAPYIEISDRGREYRLVFYDVTDRVSDLEALSERVRSMYQSYLALFLVPAGDVQDVLDQPHLFSLLVLREHAECFAGALYAYLSQALRQKT